jgi:PAS domain S-box-containing protein
LVIYASGRTVDLWSHDAHLRIEFASRSVYVDSHEVALTPKEYEVLACLAERVGTVVPVAHIIESVWGEWFGSTEHIFVHVHNIRRKLGPCGDLLVTKRRAGYLLRREPSEPRDASEHSDINQRYVELLSEDAWARRVVWFLLGGDARVMWVSESIAELMGWPPQHLLGKHPWSIADSGARDDLMACFTTGGGASRVSTNTRLRHADGEVIPIAMAAQVLWGMDGRPQGGIGEWSRDRSRAAG